MKTSLHEFGPSDRDRWNDFVRAASNASILQSYEWGEVKRGTWIPHYVAAVDGAKLLCAALVLERSLPVVGRKIFYAPRGPVFTDAAQVGPFLEALAEFVTRHRGILLQVDPEIAEEDVRFPDAAVKAGFRRSPSNIQPRGTIILDVRPDEESLLKTFHHKTRYNIKLAEKKGVTVREENADAGVDVFYDLFRQTAERDRFMILHRSYFHRLWKTLSERHMAAIFVAYFQDEPLAAIFQTVFAGRMTYLYGASSNAHRNLMPNHLVHWRAIQWAKNRGVTHYDFWGIPANPKEGHPLWGVYRFKKGFCETETRWVGTYQRVLSPFWHRLYEKGVPAVKSVFRFLRTGSWQGSLEE